MFILTRKKLSKTAAQKSVLEKLSLIPLRYDTRTWRVISWNTVSGSHWNATQHWIKCHCSSIYNYIDQVSRIPKKVTRIFVYTLQQIIQQRNYLIWLVWLFYFVNIRYFVTLLFPKNNMTWRRWAFTILQYKGKNNWENMISTIW